MLWVPSFSLWCMRLLHDLLQQATDQYQFCTAGGDWQASKWILICIYSHSASFTLLPELCILLNEINKCMHLNHPHTTTTPPLSGRKLPSKESIPGSKMIGDWYLTILFIPCLSLLGCCHQEEKNHSYYFSASFNKL